MKPHLAPISIRTVESALGCWVSAEWRPPHLSELVDHIWYFEGRTTHSRERVFPNGLLEIVVMLGAPFRELRGGGPMTIYPGTCVSGAQTGPVVIEAPDGANSVLGIRLHPAGAFRLLGASLDTLAGITADLRDLVGGAADELTERCEEGRTPAARVYAAGQWVTDRLQRAPDADPATHWVAEEMRRRHGAVRIDALRERTGLTKARLAAAFRREVGLSPKRYARVLRFRRALELLHGGRATLSTLASDAGYYDQSHMTAEFRELAGLTPGAMASATRYPNSASLPEP